MASIHNIEGSILNVQLALPQAPIMSDNELEAMYPRIEMMMFVNLKVYREHIHIYH